MPITPQEALQRTIEHREIFHDEMLHIMRLIMSGELSPVMTAALDHRPAREEGNHRRDHRRGAGDARVLHQGATWPTRRTWSTSSAPAATARTPSTSRPARCSWRPRPAPRSASTAAAASAASRGSADVLEALGLNINLSPEAIAKCIEEVGIGFMFAPNHHPAMKNVAPVRKELGVRTIFNILGPLTNPASAPNILMGVFHPDLVGIQVRALQRLGAEHAMVVYGRDGMDEVSLGAATWSASSRTARSPSTRSIPRTSACPWPATAR
jgi:anthranilate phosphoribosyltransferase